ncbi:hypothetical protein GBA52_028327 [Prunus armeniaca]|nr:hypothetical protein GBA52_028327 [Prunus armeniaca]
MSLPKKGTFTNDTKLSTTNKATALNPNAAEFVPFSLRSPSSGSTSTGQAATKFFFHWNIWKSSTRSNRVFCIK